MMDASFAFEVGAAICVQVSLVVMSTFAMQYWLGEARSSCRLWTICFVSMLCLIAAALSLPHRRLFAFPTSLTHETLLSLLTWQSHLVAGVSCVWLLGILLLVVHRGVGCLQLVSFLKSRCDTLSTKEMSDLPLDLHGHDRHLIEGDRRLETLRVMVSDQIQGPFCWQLHRPVIVLPRYVIDEDEMTLRHILLHELEHLRTKHPMQHFLQGLCSTIFWFHPAVWLAAHRAEMTREYLCDEVAAIAGGKYSAYLRTLVKIAERCGNVSCTNLPRGTLAFGNRKSALVRRSDRLVKLAQQPPKVTRHRSACAFLGLVACAIFASQIWVPTNASASNRSKWSPWPAWSAKTLHSFDVSVRDFEPFDERTPMHELLGDDD